MSKARNIRTEQYTVRVDRATRWGNPFHIGRDGTRTDVIKKYRAWLWDEIKADRVTREDLAELHNETLGCWCAPQACHADVLSIAAAWAYGELAREDVDKSAHHTA